MGTKSSRQQPREGDCLSPDIEPLPDPIRKRLANVLVRGCHSLELEKFHLNHHYPRDFTRPTCGKCPIFLFVLFRFGGAGYALVFLLYYLIGQLSGVVGGKIFIYMETWTYIGVAFYLTLSFLNVAIDLFREYREPNSGQLLPSGPTPWRFKLQWMFFNISIVSTFAGTITFWIWVLITENLPNNNTIFVVVNLHGLLAVVGVVEFGLATIPIRFEHILYPLLYGMTYLIFTVIYWAAGGTDPYGHRYIYSFLDYGRHPAGALYVVLAEVIGSFLIHGFFTMLFGFKAKIFDKCCPNAEDELEVFEMGESEAKYERLE